MTKNVESSALLAMPREVRDMIYGLVLNNISWRSRRFHAINGHDNYIELDRAEVPVFAKVCKDIRHEFAHIFIQKSQLSVAFGPVDLLSNNMKLVLNRGTAAWLRDAGCFNLPLRHEVTFSFLSEDLRHDLVDAGDSDGLSHLTGRHWSDKEIGDSRDLASEDTGIVIHTDPRTNSLAFRHRSDKCLWCIEKNQDQDPLRRPFYRAVCVVAIGCNYRKRNTNQDPFRQLVHYHESQLAHFKDFFERFIGTSKLEPLTLGKIDEVARGMTFREAFRFCRESEILCNMMSTMEYHLRKFSRALARHGLSQSDFDMEVVRGNKYLNVRVVCKNTRVSVDIETMGHLQRCIDPFV